MKKVLAIALLATMVLSGSAFAAGLKEHRGNAGHAAYLMNEWREQCKAGDTVNPVIRAYRVYYDRDIFMTYYDEWVVQDKAIKSAFESKGLTSVGLPTEYLDAISKGNN